MDFIFDVIFDGVSAWTQIGYFIMAFVFSAIGGGIIAYEMYWRINADRVKGRISSVRVTGKRKGDVKDGGGNGEVFYSVFEYPSRNGEILEHVSDAGSNGLHNKIPGSKVSLMVFPDTPGKVRRPSLVLVVFGLVFLLPGLFMWYVAVTSFDPNPMFFALILSAVCFVFFKVWSFFKDIPREELKEGWKSFRDNKLKISSSSSDSHNNGRVLSNEEIMDRLKVHGKSYKVASIIMIVIGFGLSIGAYYAGLNMANRLQNGLFASGEVVSIRSEYSSSSDSSGYTYYAIVGFSDENGRSFEFSDSVGASSPMFSKGDKVDVVYDESDPEDAIIDRGIFNWSLSFGLAVGALLSFWFAIYSIKVCRRLKTM
ncbi:MAG: DUF3592 domain-containing protein [Alphaproteobacteria bacterium]